MRTLLHRLLRFAAHALLALLVVAGTISTAEARPGPVNQRPGPRVHVVPGNGGGGGAAAKPRQTSQVQVGVMVVHASEDGTTMDPKLGSLERYLRHLRYSSYEVLSSRNLDLSQGVEKTLSVEGGREVAISLVSTDGNKARFRVQVRSGKRNLADITVSVGRDKTFVVSGPQYEGGILLIPITARF